MFRTCGVLIALLSLSPLSAVAAPPTVILIASLNKPIYSEGQPVVLTLALQNDDSQTLSIAGNAFEYPSLRINVTNSVGEPISRTRFGQRTLTPQANSGSVRVSDLVVTLRPGQKQRYRFNLARLFDLSRDGGYTVTVSRFVDVSRFPFPWGGSILPHPFVLPPLDTLLTAAPVRVRMVDHAAGSGPVALTPPPVRQTFLYLVNGRSQHQAGDPVYRYRIGNNGLPLPTVAPPTFAGNRTVSVAATPDGRFLYVANNEDSTVSQFRVGSDGALQPLSPPTLPCQENPDFLLMDPKGRFVYALSNYGNTLFGINPDGRLTVTARMPFAVWDKNRNHTVVPSDSGVIDATGHFLYVCPDWTYGGLTYGYRLGSDGRVTALPPPTGGQSGERDRAVALSPSNPFAFVLTPTSYMGGSSHDVEADQVIPMRVETDGSFTVLPGAQTLPGVEGIREAGDTPMTIDPSGRFLLIAEGYLIVRYRIGQDGSLISLGTTLNGDPYSFLFGRVDRMVYALNRYYNNPVTIFRLNDHGVLTQVGTDKPNSPLNTQFVGGAALANAPTPQAWGPASGGLEVSARLEREVFPVNAPVVLTVVLKNVTSRPVALGRADADMSLFRVTLTGPQRQLANVSVPYGNLASESIPLLAAGRDLRDIHGSSGAPLVLPPGAQRQYRLMLSRLVDLSVADNYIVQVRRVLPVGVSVFSSLLHFRLENPTDGISGYSPERYSGHDSEEQSGSISE